ncbi:hypothetical protein GXB85_13845 [Cellulomonas sp. APG4]|uniref:hypothetical protein n=1 Tax=Cellulomonas sp. APG4 TaxID=1538656 RepID=UPI00137B709C|nr:hypothetical protein [Cellulomonas sp. APG4]NCT92025.1 hypothetical protein [Cellulomonas sp. APG4]
MRRSLLAALLVSALLLVYVVAVAGRGVALVGTGEPVAVALGLAVLVLPLLAVWLVVREWTLATRVQRLADALAAQGRLPVDDLPRTPAGRVVRAAADEAFDAARREVEQRPDDPASWFRLGFAYDASGDRRRARAALRTATRLARRRD